MSNDEKKKSGLGNFLGQLQEGVSRLNNKRPDRENRENEPSVDDSVTAGDSLLDSQDHAQVQGKPQTDEMDEGALLLDSQATNDDVPKKAKGAMSRNCLLYTSPSPRD